MGGERDRGRLGRSQMIGVAFEQRRRVDQLRRGALENPNDPPRQLVRLLEAPIEETQMMDPLHAELAQRRRRLAPPHRREIGGLARRIARGAIREEHHRRLVAALRVERQHSAAAEQLVVGVGRQHDDPPREAVRVGEGGKRWGIG